mgnify:CR=1 FL=1
MSEHSPEKAESGLSRPVNRTRMKFVERLLVEASGNDPRKVLEGSVRLFGVGSIDWTERTPRGLVARTSSVSTFDLWDLLGESLNPYGKEADRG